MKAEREQRFNEAFAALKGFNMRRAFISTQCGLMKARHLSLKTESTYNEFEKFRRELSLIDEESKDKFPLLRKYQTRYLVEYETEERDVKSKRLGDHINSEQLLFFNDCELNTFENGWNIEDSATQDLLYEIAEFILKYKTGKYLIKNVRKLQDYNS